MTGFLQRTARVAEHAQIAERTWRVRLEAAEIAARITPGQFVMLRLPGTTDPLLGRPFALYDTVLAGGAAVAFDVVYLVVGKMTGRLTSVRVDDTVEVWGPLGRGFSPGADAEEVTLVAGGIGQTPFLAYGRGLLGGRGYGGAAARRRAGRVRLLYGVRTASLAAGVDDFRSAGLDVQLATDDGSAGHHGFVTDLLRAEPPRGPVAACGPEPMLRAAAGLAAERGVPCQVSLETPMACGVGLCFSCVAPVKHGDAWDYKRVCVDGPVFDAAELAW